MKKFSMFAAIAAMIAIGSLSHAEIEGEDAGAFDPGAPAATRHIYPHRFHQGEIVRCLITGIVFPTVYNPGSANVEFVNSHGEREPGQPIFGVIDMNFLQGVRANLIQRGICPEVRIEPPPGWVPGAVVPPVVGGPAAIVPPGAFPPGF